MNKKLEYKKKDVKTVETGLGLLIFGLGMLFIGLYISNLPITVFGFVLILAAILIYIFPLKNE